ncbi:MAG: glycosyltransferase [Anaerolineae bacterium]|jgi:cellulose synthase/poly-beta-1,6-N-acetylglucosamine synthase-like glycosyltransferase|nr:glycosyltransferase [Anaerolineae bacterium]
MPEGPSPTVSVVIPARNAAATLPACLDALRGQTGSPPRFEVIVVDDGSTDDTATVAEAAGARVVRIAHAGRAAARNRGAEAARGALLLFTDADCVPNPDWVSRLAAPFADASVAGARGVYRTRQRSLVARFVQIEYEDKYRLLKPLQDIDFVDTYSAAYRREVFLANGGFDPSLPFDEDQDFSFRLANRGHRLVFVPDAIVYHRHTESLRAYASKKFRIGFWKAKIVLTHPNKLARDTHTPLSQRVQLVLFYLTVLLCIIAAAGLASFWWPVAAALALTATTLPFAVRAARKDALVGVAAPLLLWVRAAALGAGFALGMARFLPRRLRRR